MVAGIGLRLTRVAAVGADGGSLGVMTKHTLSLAALLLLLVSTCAPRASDPGGEAAGPASGTAPPQGAAADGGAADGDPEPQTAQRPDPHPCVAEALAAERVRGVDVSHHSGDVDWLTVCRSGHGFAYVKASEGVDDPDPRFAEHWRALWDLGMPRGAYHFYVTEDDPDAQADLFLSTVDLHPGDLVPVVDVELIGHGTEPGWQDGLRRFLDRVEGEVGVRPMIYTSPDFWDAHLGAGFDAHPLWVSEYGVEEPRVPTGWKTWHLWQYAGDQQVPGVEKDTDVNRLHPETELGELRIRG